MFAKAGLQELVSGMERLPVIRAVSLRNNGINDEHEKEIMSLLSISKIKSVDLSCNEIEGKLAAKIGRKLHEVSHLVWIDLTQNYFLRTEVGRPDRQGVVQKAYDSVIHSAIVNGFRRQKDLMYAGLSCEGA